MCTYCCTDCHFRKNVVAWVLKLAQDVIHILSTVTNYVMNYKYRKCSLFNNCEKRCDSISSSSQGKFWVLLSSVQLFSGTIIFGFYIKPVCVPTKMAVQANFDCPERDKFLQCYSKLKRFRFTPDVSAKTDLNLLFDEMLSLEYSTVLVTSHVSFLSL